MSRRCGDPCAQPIPSIDGENRSPPGFLLYRERL
jgi:hypothetical protein